MHQQERNQQPTDATISVHKWMNCLELIVNQREANQWGRMVLFMQVQFERIQGFIHLLHRGWNKRSVGEGASRRADPILGAAKVSRRSILAAYARHQLLMQLANQPQTEWERLQTLQSMLQSLNIVEDLANIGWGRCSYARQR